MRVLLLFPPGVVDVSYPPLGLAYVAAVLERNGHDVRVLDASAIHLNQVETVGAIKAFKPDILGMTTNSVWWDKCKLMCDSIARESLGVPIILGGPHVTVRPIQTLKDNRNIDVVVIGEGETTVLELVETIERGGSLDHIKGIAYRCGESIRLNPPRERIKNLSELPFPARHLLPLRSYNEHITSALAGRGCPFNCAFCSVGVQWGRIWRVRSPENVIEEMTEVKQTFGYQHISFQDDEFTLNRKWTKSFCEKLIAAKIDVSWMCLSRVDTVSADILALMKRAGCKRINFGVESGDMQILKKVRKQITPRQAISAFHLAKRFRIATCAYFMIGNIGENIRTVAETIKLALSLDPEFIMFSIATPLPGTEMRKEAEALGMLMSENLSELNYYGGHAVMKLKDLSPEEILSLQKIAYAIYYGRPLGFLLRNAIYGSLSGVDPLPEGRIRHAVYSLRGFLFAMRSRILYRRLFPNLYVKLVEAMKACSLEKSDEAPNLLQYSGRTLRRVRYSRSICRQDMGNDDIDLPFGVVIRASDGDPP